MYCGMELGICQNIDGFETDGLVKQDASAGPDAQFAALVGRSSRFMFRVAYALLKNPQDAEDAVQEAFLKLYRNGAWKSMKNERAFLARITWRVAIDRLPKNRGEAIRIETPSNEDNPEAVAIEADWNATVHAFVNALPEELRQPLALSTVDELTSREIGVVMGIPEGTVRSRLARARQILKQKIGAALGVGYER
jgi:RNA polymerase sigma-70 factor (ECF subfamily)